MTGRRPPGAVLAAAGGCPHRTLSRHSPGVATVATRVGWLLRRAVVPRAAPSGDAIAIGEVRAGLVLIGGPLRWPFAWHRLSDRVMCCLTRR